MIALAQANCHDMASCRLVSPNVKFMFALVTPPCTRQQQLAAVYARCTQ